MSLTVDAQNYRITATRGDDHKIRFTVKNSSGVAYDVSANTFKFTVKASLDDSIANAKFQKLSPAANGIDLTNATSGIVDVNLVPSDTDALAGLYYYDLEMTEGGKLYTLRQGVLMALKSVTTPGSAGTPASTIVPFPGGVAITGPFYVFSPNGDGLWHKFDIINDGFGNYLLTDVGQNPTYPF